MLNMVMSMILKKKRGKYPGCRTQKTNRSNFTMESSSIVDVWNTFKDSIDKKQIEIVAESFVDVCADYGADDTDI